jgi:hypothetical protein
MSFTEQTDPNAPVTPPPAEAPVIAPKASGGLAPDVNLPGRSVFLTAPQLAEIQEKIFLVELFRIAAMPRHANVEVLTLLIKVNYL